MFKNSFIIIIIVLLLAYIFHYNIKINQYERLQNNNPNNNKIKNNLKNNKKSFNYDNEYTDNKINDMITNNIANTNNNDINNDDDDNDNDDNDDDNVDENNDDIENNNNFEQEILKKMLSKNHITKKKNITEEDDNICNNFDGYDGNLEFESTIGYNKQKLSDEEKLSSGTLLPKEIKEEWSGFESMDTKEINDDSLLNIDRPLSSSTVQGTLKNPNYDIRGNEPCPKRYVGPWGISTIQPDDNLKKLC
jgi:hypothetical protein